MAELKMFYRALEPVRINRGAFRAARVCVCGGLHKDYADPSIPRERYKKRVREGCELCKRVNSPKTATAAPCTSAAVDGLMKERNRP